MNEYDLKNIFCLPLLLKIYPIVYLQKIQPTQKIEFLFNLESSNEIIYLFYHE